MIITQNLQPALRTAFRIANSRFEDSRLSQLRSIYYEDTIDELISEEYWLGDIPGIREWVTRRTYQDILEYSKRLISKPWTTGGWRYNRVQRTGPNIPQLTKKMGRTINICERLPADQSVQLLKDGGNATALAYDGYPFFQDDTTNRNFKNQIIQTGTSFAALKTDLENAMDTMAEFKTDTDLDIELEPTLIVCPWRIYLDLVTLVTSASSTEDNKNSGVVNPIKAGLPNFRVEYSRKLTGNTWYLIHDEIMQPTYWQTTRVEGQRIILDVKDETADEGWYGIAASIWGIGDYGFPWTCVKVGA